MLFRKYSAPFALCLVVFLVSTLLAQDPFAPLPPPKCDNKCRLKQYFKHKPSDECRWMEHPDCFLCVGPNGLATLCRNDTPSSPKPCLPTTVPQRFWPCTNCSFRCPQVPATIWTESTMGEKIFPMDEPMANGVVYICRDREPGE
jgi:hypothetical protein